MYVMGINSVFHESAACLLKDGEVLSVVEEERFNRMKHGKKPREDNPDELPMNAIQYCLDEAGIGIEDVAYIGYSLNPEKMPTAAFHDLFSDEWGGAEGLKTFNEKVYLVDEHFKKMGFKGEVKFLDHHISHAASAYHASPFDEAAVLVVDGIGETSSTTFYQGKANKLEFLQSVEYPASLGFLWEVTSHMLGFSIYDAAKVMGLASYGDPAPYIDYFRQIVKKAPNGQFTMNNDVLKFGTITYDPPSANVDKLAELFEIKKRDADEEIEQKHEDIAAALQVITDEIILHMVNHLHEQTGMDNLCLAGGVTLNCVTNRVAFEQSDFKQLYVQPAAHDAGTAIGAAYFIWNQTLDNLARTPMDHAYYGPAYDDAALEKALKARNLTYSREDNIEARVAKLLTDDNIVSFFQGRMEVGPRALGNRSLLADPRDPDMQGVLNRKVKHREYFRPLAPSVLAEEAHAWFNIGKDNEATDFMLMIYSVNEGVKDKIPAVVHTDGTSRIQTVRTDTNPRYHRVISEFNKLTGVPMLLNTSFNDNEPIVCSPEDAIHTFMKTEIDYLALGDFLVSKEENRSV